MRHYDIDVSIITRLPITSNLKSIIDYAVERGITYELNKFNGKITFHYDAEYYYYRNYIHYSYLKLCCPVGYDPGDIDLPERLVYKRKNVVEESKGTYYQCSAEICDISLTHPNNYGNYIEEEEIIGHCCIAKLDDMVKSILETDSEDLLIKSHFRI